MNELAVTIAKRFDDQKLSPEDLEMIHKTFEWLIVEQKAFFTIKRAIVLLARSLDSTHAYLNGHSAVNGTFNALLEDLGKTPPQDIGDYVDLLKDVLDTISQRIRENTMSTDQLIQTVKLIRPGRS